MEAGRRVLVVDRLTETADVLRAVLEPRGVSVDRATRAPLTMTAAAAPQLSAMVVDEETIDASPWNAGKWRGVPRVIIGTIPIPPTDAGAKGGEAASRRYLSKPFQYAELIGAIEALIGPG